MRAGRILFLSLLIISIMGSVAGASNHSVNATDYSTHVEKAMNPASADASFVLFTSVAPYLALTGLIPIAFMLFFSAVGGLWDKEEFWAVFFITMIVWILSIVGFSYLPLWF